MTLQDVIHKYISWRRVQGAKFETEAVLLYAFARHVGGAIGCDTVTSGQVCSYLVGNGSLTRYRANKYCALKGFYVYAVSCGYGSGQDNRCGHTERVCDECQQGLMIRIGDGRAKCQAPHCLRVVPVCRCTVPTPMVERSNRKTSELFWGCQRYGSDGSCEATRRMN